MPVQVSIESQGMSSCGESFRVSASWRHKGCSGKAEFLAWDSMPNTWVDGLRNLANAIEGALGEDAAEHQRSEAIGMISNVDRVPTSTDYRPR